jgi:hypothetical protein
LAPAQAAAQVGRKPGVGSVTGGVVLHGDAEREVAAQLQHGHLDGEKVLGCRI